MSAAPRLLVSVGVRARVRRARAAYERLQRAIAHVGARPPHGFARGGEVQTPVGYACRMSAGRPKISRCHSQRPGDNGTCNCPPASTGGPSA